MKRRSSRPSEPCSYMDTKGYSAPTDYEPLLTKFMDLFPGVLATHTHAEIIFNLYELSKTQEWKLLSDSNLTQYIKVRG